MEVIVKCHRVLFNVLLLKKNYVHIKLLIYKDQNNAMVCMVKKKICIHTLLLHTLFYDHMHNMY